MKSLFSIIARMSLKCMKKSQITLARRQIAAFEIAVELFEREMEL